MKKSGLREITEDRRDFQLGALYLLPELDELPESFELEPYSIKDQGNTDMCSAFASCGMSELQEGVELRPEWSFAASKAITGDPDRWGQNMRDALKAHQKYGAVPKRLLNEVPTEYRKLEEYDPKYIEIAKKYKKQSYFKVTGPYDHFDNIRASIYHFRDQKQAVAIGVIFAWPISQRKLDTIKESGFGHMMYVTGWNKDGLIVVNSYGKKAGVGGKHIITREVMNHFAGQYGVMMMVDEPPESAKKRMERVEWYHATLLGKLRILLYRLFT